MGLRKCPVCGGKLRSETLGWICYDCQGFIDMQGVFHEHTEKPFMPPMTNADRIRAMSDEELAKIIMCPYDVDPDSCCPESTCLECCKKWLKQPAEEGADNG